MSKCEECEKKQKKIRRLQAKIRSLNKHLDWHLAEEEERLHPTSYASMREKEAVDAVRRKADEDFWSC